MSSILSISLFIQLLLLFGVQDAGATPPSHNLIHETCRKCARNDPNLSYDFCVTSLQAAPDSRCANLTQLGVISLKLTRQNLTATKKYIRLLLKNKTSHQYDDPYIRSCLKDCFRLYSDAILSLKEAIADYKSTNYADANIKVSSVLDASTTCEDGFKEKQGVSSPLTKRNGDTFHLSALALSIINMHAPPPIRIH
ncbi:hypothetical protein Tsubulata_050426 [Turnera subulata]|uniref:Pectinesterase inhibitor domain-containing protein n=1 Tax=Turnera subulata TaxID=218843 RepID=A0A9Q0GF57_9ROSI|nr:hypothetical protein Tsubulata_050426 [Turnera subulata]